MKKAYFFCYCPYCEQYEINETAFEQEAAAVRCPNCGRELYIAGIKEDDIDNPHIINYCIAQGRIHQSLQPLGEISYFELGDLIQNIDYPDDDLFFNLVKYNLKDDTYAKANKLCVGIGEIDWSSTYCVSAPTAFIRDNYPSLLSEYHEFLRYPNRYGKVYGRYGHLFVPYEEVNFGITYFPKRQIYY